MKTFTAAAAATMALAIGVQAQNLPPDFTSIPSCAFNPLLDAVAATTCSQTDVACWCSSAAWKSTLESETSVSCTSAADASKAYSILENTCSLNGVTISLGGSGSGGSTTTTSVAVTNPPTGGNTGVSPTPTTTNTPGPTSNAPAPPPPTSGGPVAPPSGSAVPPTTYTGGAPPSCGGPWKFPVPGGWPRYPPGRQGQGHW